MPLPLPPAKPPLSLSAFSEPLRAAEQALVRVELAGQVVPSLDWLVYASVRKEAVLSSQIEGTQATLVELLTFEAAVKEESPTPDVEEVSNYLDALRHARARLAHPKGLPLSMRLLDETHRRLMRGVRGAEKHPGEVRRSQSWIGDETVASARELFALVSADRARVVNHDAASVASVRLFELLPRRPIVSVASVMTLLDTTKPTAGRAVESLVALGVLVETTGRKRDRSFSYGAYLERLRVGTEL